LYNKIITNWVFLHGWKRKFWIILIINNTDNNNIASSLCLKHNMPGILPQMAAAKDATHV